MCLSQHLPDLPAPPPTPLPFHMELVNDPVPSMRDLWVQGRGEEPHSTEPHTSRGGEWGVGSGRLTMISSYKKILSLDLQKMHRMYGPRQRLSGCCDRWEHYVRKEVKF